MAIPFLSDIKLNGNQIKELVVDHKSGGHPTSGYHGQLIFRSDQDKVYVNTSTDQSAPSWASIAGDITSIVAGAGLTTPDGTTGDVTINAIGGDGITVGADEIEVTVDDSTLELSGTDGSGAVRIKDSGVATAKIADDAVTLAKLAHQTNNTVFKVNGSGVPTAGTIDTANITDDAINGDKIADDAINSEHYVDGSIDTAHIGNDQVTYAKIQNVAANNVLLGNISGADSVVAELGANDLTALIKDVLNNNMGTVTIGDSNDTVAIPGNLQVTGTTTTNNVETVSTSNGVVFEGTVADDHDATLLSVVADSDKTYTLPNITGYVPILTNDPGTTAISATAAELNIMDGGTSATSTTIVDADRFVMNDAGTMKQVAASDVKTYVETFISSREFVVALDPSNADVTKTGNIYTVTHGLGTRNVLCQVIEHGGDSTASTNSDKKHQTVNVDVDRPDNAGNTVDVIFGQTVTNGAYKILITKIG